MTKEISLFLPNPFYEEIIYQYEGKDMDLRKLVFGFLTPLAKQGKMVKLNGSIQARVYKDGKLAMEEKELKTVDLITHAVGSDSKWITEKVTQEEIKIYKMSISDRLYEDLIYFGKVFCARLSIYNDSLDKKAEDYKEKVAKYPACLEQIIQDNVVGQLSQSVAGNIDNEYLEEFNELEKGIAEKTKKIQPRKKA